MRALIAGALPPNPWLMGAFLLVIAIFAVVLTISLKPGRPQDIQSDSELPFKD
jgi:hypothetical protein